MTLASSSLAQVRWIEEATFGVIPVTGNPNDMRMTGESLAYSISKTESAEIRSDRQITDLISTGAGASGGINIELSYKEYDTLIRAVMMSAWVYYGVQTAGVGQGVGTSFVPTFTTSTITAGTAPTSTSAFTTLTKGQWFKLNAVGSVNHGGTFRVSGSVSPTSTVITVDASTPLVADTAAAATISSSRVSNGTTKTQFTLERALNDVSQFFAYTGMTASKLNLKWASGSITGGSFDFMGKSGVRGTSSALPASPVASLAYDVMNGVSGVASIMEGGSLLTGAFIKSLDLSIDNSLRAIDAIGTLGSVAIGTGTIKVTGTMEVYLADGALYDKFINNTLSSLQFLTKDSAGNGYAIQVPALKYGDAKVQAGSKDQDIMLSIPFTGIMDTVTGKTLIIDRFGV